ncbi:hypothetical protein K435DRAFT_850780 [Dendrothele bispora CBS 962.96]|uniref:Uncharacterized protein n=1 Tax=Dendrothele bispora (strain CBS 962.96) TaxID=1314807 RepID=A0A4S8MNH6_DENBC|nr:hypothetical protein K435DRAFT_850780 [Dendrothele bispora CBS 962.96]
MQRSDMLTTAVSPIVSDASKNMGVIELGTDGLSMEQVWKNVYEKRRAQWKLKASKRPESTVQKPKKRNLESGIRENINLRSRKSLEWEASIRADIPGDDPDKDVNIDAFIASYAPPLNTEQERAF